MRPPPSLNDDIRLLGRTLGDVIADQAGTATLDLVEAIRRAAVGDSDPGRLIDLLDPLPIADALHVIRAFSYFAMLANIAEDTDHARRRRSLVHSGAPPPAGHARTSDPTDQRRRASIADDVRRAVAASEVVPVLTAHPTEIRRRTIQSIQTAVAALMEQRDRFDMNRVEAGGVERRAVASDRHAVADRDAATDEAAFARRGQRRDALLRPVAAVAGPAVERRRQRRVRRSSRTASGHCCESARGSAVTATATPSSQPMSWPTRSNNRRPRRWVTTCGELWRLAEDLSMSSRLVTVDDGVQRLAELAGDTSPTASTSRTVKRSAACTPGSRRPRRR